MRRRETLKLLAAGTALGVLPAAVRADMSPAATLVFDGRNRQARAAAEAYGGPKLDCSHDAAQLWYAHLAPKTGPVTRPIIGLTGAADAAIFADCARRDGLRLHHPGHGPAADGLVAWYLKPA